jgi:3-hydroxyisobutyrate dehydrogenase-like beta-hydroxyacid dehydrogenase
VRSRRRIGVLHPGQMGAAIAAQAVRNGVDVAWCPTGRGPASRARAISAGLTPVAGLADLLDSSSVVLSICPPAAAENVASSVAEHGFAGIYVEANAISVRRSQMIMERVASSGARAVDGAIIGPPPRDDLSTTLYVAGADGDMAEVTDIFRESSVRVVPTGGDQGSASALKMAYAGYQKATRTLAALAHALAAGHGVTAHLLVEAARGSRSPLAEPEYLPSVAARAWRWGPELYEVADTLAALGLPSELARATATTLGRWEDRRDVWDLPLETVLGDLADGHRDRRRSGTAG